MLLNTVHLKLNVLEPATHLGLCYSIYIHIQHTTHTHTGHWHSDILSTPLYHGLHTISGDENVRHHTKWWDFVSTQSECDIRLMYILYIGGYLMICYIYSWLYIIMVDVVGSDVINNVDVRKKECKHSQHFIVAVYLGLIVIYKHTSRVNT